MVDQMTALPWQHAIYSVRTIVLSSRGTGFESSQWWLAPGEGDKVAGIFYVLLYSQKVFFYFQK
jgi:hypothetical protein